MTGSVPALIAFFGHPVAVTVLATAFGATAALAYAGHLCRSPAVKLRFLFAAFHSYVLGVIFVTSGFVICSAISEVVEYEVAVVKLVAALAFFCALAGSAVLSLVLRSSWPGARKGDPGRQADERIVALVADVTRKMGGGSPPRLVVVGSRRLGLASMRARVPTIVVSRRALEILDREELEAAVAHEIAHLRMRWCPGVWGRVFLRITRFDPVFRGLSRAIRAQEEYAADEAAVRVTKRGSLARAILKLAGEGSPSRPWAACALASDVPGVQARLARLG